MYAFVRFSQCMRVLRRCLLCVVRQLDSSLVHGSHGRRQRIRRAPCGGLEHSLASYPYTWDGGLRATIPARACLRRCGGLPTRRSLVIVRYSPRHNTHDEWVYNDADLDGA